MATSNTASSRCLMATAFPDRSHGSSRVPRSIHLLCAPRNHAACVGSYCDAILSGEIIAGRYVELAARRYLDDLEHAHERGLYFDPMASQSYMDEGIALMELARRHQCTGWRTACGQQPDPHRRQERRRGYFMIWQFGKACRNASTPARLSAQWNISAACFSISRHRRW